MSHLFSSDLPLPSNTTTTNPTLPIVSDIMALPPYNIDDLITPNSSLTNITSLPNGDTTRSLLAGHDGLTTNINNTTHTISPSSSVNNTLPKIDPLHGLLLGNTTAFDAVTTQQQDHRTHISPSQQPQQQATVAVTTSPSARMNDLFQTKGNTEKDSSSILINSRSITVSILAQLLMY
ncbi:unnamed protein product [Rotaria sp. Silwood1]|nr:unnamed protein product [Rotaria sp. Silwood1]CAF1155757.1 unnamed protein product [Rotaria sp. Silwood1]CAF3425858.1 unnamed protein product [Rotaria sp. Silwood1]CAF3438887.1 unnamed protein product [Rotaria sp. Silwood1]CAF3467473.1 unnamed protein product [Rotaria sp. Silwood1]